MKKIIAPLAFTLISYVSYSQQTGTIKGKVLEQSTKQPIGGAIVVIQNTQLAPAADSTGAFTILNVPEGNYSLVISFIGFQQKTVTDVIVVRNKTFYVESELFESYSQMSEVTEKPLTLSVEKHFMRESQFFQHSG